PLPECRASGARSDPNAGPYGFPLIHRGRAPARPVPAQHAPQVVSSGPSDRSGDGPGRPSVDAKPLVVELVVPAAGPEFRQRGVDLSQQLRLLRPDRDTVLLGGE